MAVNLKPGKKISKSNLIDTLAGFSSQGPRDLDALIKPEISAPGQAIISAGVGSGDKGVMLGGTSMASPHAAGVAALLVQYRRDLEPEALKAVLMNTSTLISDEGGVTYPVSRQGAGRIRAFDALRSELLFSMPAISLGKIAVDKEVIKTETLTITNFGKTKKEYNLQVENGKNLSLKVSDQKLVLSPGESIQVEVSARVSAPLESETVEEDAFIIIKSGSDVLGQIPVLAVINRNSLISPIVLNIEAGSAAESEGADVEAFFINESKQDGLVLLFNKLGEDKRKTESTDRSLSFACDLESAGYRVIEKDGVSHLEVATKIYNPVSTWKTCDINIELDLDSDGVVDKTVYGSDPTNFPGLIQDQELAQRGLSTMVFDSKKLSALLVAHEKAVAEQNERPPVLNFLSAFEKVSSMTHFEHSTIGVASVSLEGLSSLERFNIKLSVSFNGGDVQEREDSLSDVDSVWKTVDLKGGAGYSGMPAEFIAEAGKVSSIKFKKGKDQKGELIAYFPRNEFNLLRKGRGKQAAVMKAKFGGGLDLP